MVATKNLDIEIRGSRESRGPAPTLAAVNRARVPGGLPRREVVLSGLVAVVVAGLVFARYGINGDMSRDEGIYAYAGQQLARGVAPYASIFDPKGPVAAVIAGVAAWVGGLLGLTDFYLIRVAFFACALASVAAMHLLATRLWHSWLAGLTAALALVAIPAFAMDALPGPDAKTPGVALVLLAMLYLVERRWFGAGVLASLAVLTWQPWFVYALVAVLLAACRSAAGERLQAVARVVAGGLLPLVLTVIGFAAAGALGDLYTATLDYPLTGVQRQPETFAEHVGLIAQVVADYGGGSFFWTGVVLLLVAVVVDVVRHPGRSALGRPLVAVVLLTGIGEFGYALVDFQGYPDLYALLPYAALGFGGLVGLVTQLLRPRLEAGPVRLAMSAVLVVALLATSWLSWERAAQDPLRGALVAERSDACGLSRIVVPGTPLWSLGDPMPLVLTHRTNPEPFVYLSAGVDQWKVDHTRGGLRGWVAQIRRSHPSVIVFQTFRGPIHDQLAAMLAHAAFRTRFLGQWQLFVDREAIVRARTVRVRLTRQPTEVATGRHGRPLPAFGCGTAR